MDGLELPSESVSVLLLVILSHSVLLKKPSATPPADLWREGGQRAVSGVWTNAK